LRIDLKMSSKGPASLVVPKKVKIARHMTILWSGSFITLTDTACIFEKCQFS